MKAKNFIQLCEICAVFLISISAHASALPKMKATYHVVDSETGLPVTNAVVRKSFVLQHDWDAVRTKQTEFKVDGNGYCTVSGETMRESGGGAGAQADGHYYGSTGFPFTGENRLLSRWEPWNPTIEVRMRPIKNPVPMIQKYIEWKPVPDIGSTVGYDLEVGDWVSPHGKGKISDLILTSSSYFREGKRGSEARYTLSFSNEHDGIQVYRFSEDMRSSFKWPYEAPLDDYQPILEKFKHWDVNGTPDKTNYDERNNYIFRVRSRQLEDGTIVACYGMINGELEFIPQGKIKLSYLFNPIEGERSLEYSGKNLLKK